MDDPGSTALTPEEQQNIASVSDVLPSWNRGDIPGVLAFYDESILWTNVAMEEAYRGKREVGSYLQRMLTAFPGLTFQVSHKIPRGHRVAERWVISGAHLGPYLGIPPTGRHVDIHGMSIVHLRAGRFVSDRFYFDTSSVLRSMGLFPSPDVFRTPVGKAVLGVTAQISAALMPGGAAAPAIQAVAGDTALSPHETANLAVVESIVAAFNAEQPDTVLAHLDPAITIDNKTYPEPQHGLASAAASLQTLADAFPAARLSLVQTLVRGDELACEFRLRGTHLGAFLGIPPSGRDVDLPGICMITFREGKVVDLAIYTDSGMLWRQLGLMPPLAFLATSVAKVSLWLAVNRLRVAAVVVALGIVAWLRSARDERA